LAAGIGADIVADEDDHAAALGRSSEEILRRQKDTVIDVGGATDFEVLNLVSDLGFVLGEGNAQLGFGGKGEQRDFIFRLEGRECGVCGFAQGAEERADGVAEIEDEGDVERKLVAAKDIDFLRDAVFAKFEIFFFEAVDDFAGLGFYRSVHHDEIDVDLNDAGSLFWGVLRLRGGGTE